MLHLHFSHHVQGLFIHSLELFIHMLSLVFACCFSSHSQLIYIFTLLIYIFLPSYKTLP